jgi:hypothetical protein
MTGFAIWRQGKKSLQLAHFGSEMGQKSKASKGDSWNTVRTGVPGINHLVLFYIGRAGIINAS